MRMDSHMYPDYLVPPNYDSLLGKLIVWGEDRTQVSVQQGGEGRTQAGGRAAALLISAYLGCCPPARLPSHTVPNP